MQRTLRREVFYPPFILLVLSAVLGFYFREEIVTVLPGLHQTLLHHLGPLFSLTVMVMVLLCFLLYLSPVGRLRLGGAGAEPLLTPWQWFSITLCTTVACGLLFWGTAEPVYHYFQPPPSLSEPREVFALASLYLHWTVSPYAIYTLPALVFAISWHNLDRPYSFSSALEPVLPAWSLGFGRPLIDCFCLYSLILGMSASLGSGLLILWGGCNYLFVLPKSTGVLALITLLLVATFVTAAISGLMHGIRMLADLNVKLFAIIMMYILIFSPITAILALSLKSLLYYGSHFASLGLRPILYPQEQWGFAWSVFYWSEWMSWAPLTAMFLAKIAKGYTVRAFILMNLAVPALLSGLWLSLFGGLSLSYKPIETLYQILHNQGPEAIMYHLLSSYPFATILISLFIMIAFLSFVTAAESCLVTIADLCSSAPASSYEKKGLILFWGAFLGLVAFIALSYAGIEGIKILANFSGIPALLLLMLVCGSACKLLLAPRVKEEALTAL